MKKNEFISTLKSVLERNKISDTAEIVEEYEQHFAFKLADGYSEEEIAARLGDPKQLAMQYRRGTSSTTKHSGALTKIGLGFADVFAGLLFLLLAAAGVVFAVSTVAFTAVGVCLIAGSSPYSLIPPIPYWCGALIGVALVALGVVAAIGCIYYWAFIRQLVKYFGRIQHNAIAAAIGNPILPSLPAYVQLAPKTNRRLRSLALIALLIFSVCFILGLVSCMLSAGSIEFWHTWGWFGY